MYGFPQNFDPEVFIGRRLSSVNFAENLITMVFDHELSVTSLNGVAYRSATDSRVFVDSPPVSYSRLPMLLGRAVEAAKLESPRQIVLELEGGGSITLTDDSESYESLILRVDGREIVV